MITVELEPLGRRAVQIILPSLYYCQLDNAEFHLASCCPLAYLCQIAWKSLPIFFHLSQLAVSLPDIKA